VEDPAHLNVQLKMIGGVLLEAVLLNVTLKNTLLAVMTLKTSVDVLKTRQENLEK
jgi:hypothetical protein